ncbi:hypothetical protein DL96DRAFT_1585712 [Flagelloscypha sp. PMI_526]|nr:hypothetical protein DL96DRAFT_1585712 [Flagelloscypha sp. PMI_526]
MRSVLINYTLPQLSSLCLYGLREMPPNIFVACKQIESLDMRKSTFADGSDENTRVLSSLTLHRLVLVDMFWDATYPDQFWMWSFLSSCPHLEMWDEADAEDDFKWEIGCDNYSQLFLVCSRSLQSLKLDNWHINVPDFDDFEHLFHLSLFPNLEDLSIVMTPYLDVPESMVLALSNIFSGITRSHPIQCFQMIFWEDHKPTEDAQVLSEWAALDDALSTTNLARIEIDFGGREEDFHRSSFYSVFAKCRSRVMFTVPT